MPSSATGTGNVYEFNGNHYEVVLFDSWVSQSHAAFAASQLSYNGHAGHLVTITSQEEQDAVESLFLQPNIGTEEANGWFYIGGSDHDSEGNFVWNQGPESGTEFTFHGYTNWWSDSGGPLSGGHSEPGSSHNSSYGEEDAVAIHPLLADSSGDTGLWFDI